MARKAKQFVEHHPDVVRDAIMRFLYQRHTTSRSIKGAEIGIRDLKSALKGMGFSEPEIVSNLRYLIDKQWVREVREERAYYTARGTKQTAPKITYVISADGIDRFQSASMFKKPPTASRINITNIQGVTVIGDSNVVNTQYTDALRTLEVLRERLSASIDLSNEEKLNVISDIGSLETQLQKTQPNKTIVQQVWANLEKAATAAGAIDLLQKLQTFLGPLLF
jgi:hypothetical protein